MAFGTGRFPSPRPQPDGNSTLLTRRIGLVGSVLLATAGIAGIADGIIVSGAAPQFGSDAVNWSSGTLEDWQAKGTAFTNQPTYGDNVKTSRVRPALSVGGDYWEAPYRVGSVGRYWIGSFENRHGPDAAWAGEQGDRPQGELYSPVFTIQHRYISMLVGGGSVFDSADNPLEGIEILVGDGHCGRDPRCFRRVGLYTGTNSEVLTRRVFDLDLLVGHAAQLVIFDHYSGPWGHVSVSDIQFTDSSPTVAPIPVWGWADIHGHPMGGYGVNISDQAQLIWGTPGGQLESSNPANDLPRCDTVGHGGGVFTAATAVQKLEVATSRAAPSFEPAHAEADAGGGLSFLTADHQQYHVSQVWRAYQGGQRLMVALVQNNKAIEFGANKIGDRWHVPTREDRDAITLEVNATKALVCLNQDWMAIAYSPAQARSIINSGKMAIILGVELDDIGGLGVASTPEGEVDWLRNVGIRHVFPVHFVDNRVGGAAQYEDLWNTLQDFLKRAPVLIHPGDDPNDDRYLSAASAGDPPHFQVPENGCSGAFRAIGQCIYWHYDACQKRAVVDGPAFAFGFIHQEPVSTCPTSYLPPAPGSATIYSSRNSRGLDTDWGVRYIRALMSRGMVIDVDHMSDRTLAGVIGSSLDYPGQPRTPGLVFSGCTDESRQACWDQAYPVASGHTSLRELALQPERGNASGGPVDSPDGTNIKEYLSKESEHTPDQMARISRLGGVAGPFAEQGPKRTSPGVTAAAPNLRNDCAESSKSFAEVWMQAVLNMGGRGVGVGTDFGFAHHVAPRFSDDREGAGEGLACYLTPIEAVPDQFGDMSWGETVYRTGTNGAEERLHPDRYRVADQRNGILYATPDVPAGAQVYSMRVAAPQDKQRDPHRPIPSDRISRAHPALVPSEFIATYPDHHQVINVYDFNYTGLAHYGMLPDLFQDMVNVGVPPEYMGPLFSSSEDYIETWEKGYRVTGCGASDDRCVHVDRATIGCFYTRPLEGNHPYGAAAMAGAVRRP
ncbi:MAG: hypothetical protein ABR598_04600 [Candidatus Dormibacteria bacterium]